MHAEPVCAYRGVVSHNRWSPARHAFAYEVFMLSFDLDVRLRRSSQVLRCARRCMNSGRRWSLVRAHPRDVNSKRDAACDRCRPSFEQRGALDDGLHPTLFLHPTPNIAALGRGILGVVLVASRGRQPARARVAAGGRPHEAQSAAGAAPWRGGASETRLLLSAHVLRRTRLVCMHSTNIRHGRRSMPPPTARPACGRCATSWKRRRARGRRDAFSC